MYELLYTSHAAAALSEQQLVDILSVSRRHNAQHGITGLLIYHEQQIVQLLEGPKEQVLSLYERIYNDCRHQSVRVAYQNNISQPAFSGWSMAFYDRNPSNVLEQLSGWEDLSNSPQPCNLLVSASRNNLGNVGKDLLLIFQDEMKQSANANNSALHLASAP